MPDPVPHGPPQPRSRRATEPNAHTGPPRPIARYLATSFRFRGYHSGGTGNDQGDGKDRRSGYGTPLRQRQKRPGSVVHRPQGSIGGPGDVVYDGLRANYQVIDTGRPGTKSGHERMMGEERLFEDALKRSPATIQPRRDPSLAQPSRRGFDDQHGKSPSRRTRSRQPPRRYGDAEETAFRRKVYQANSNGTPPIAPATFTTGPAEGTWKWSRAISNPYGGSRRLPGLADPGAARPRRAEGVRQSKKAEGRSAKAIAW